MNLTSLVTFPHIDWHELGPAFPWSPLGRVARKLRRANFQRSSTHEVSHLLFKILDAWPDILQKTCISCYFTEHSLWNWLKQGNGCPGIFLHVCDNDCIRCSQLHNLWLFHDRYVTKRSWNGENRHCGARETVIENRRYTEFGSSTTKGPPKRPPTLKDT